MKTLILLIDVWTITHLFAEGSIQYEFPNEDERKGEGCYSGVFGHLAKGEEKDLQEICERAICDSDGSGGVTYVDCGPIIVEAGEACREAQKDLSSKPYPDCCPIECE